MSAYCTEQAPQGRRRTFWTTQPEACGAQPDDCLMGQECGRPGLQLIGSSYATGEWLRGLVINILHTDGKLPDSRCGFVPGTQGGHWSESFRSDGQKIGTLIRTIQPQTSIRDALALVKARMIADLSRLVDPMKLALKIDVTTSYLGGNRVQVNIVIVGQSGETTRVGMTGDRLQNSWVWS